MKLKLDALHVTSFLIRPKVEEDGSGPITIGIVPCDTDEDCAKNKK